uniref:EF-hand domain-containing protein n=1 Tax=Paramormyrops kingsleyae TaxID=1676925 RepID=A0A3B3TCF6_9TELE
SLQKLCQSKMRSLRPAMQSLGRAVAPGDIVTKGDVESCLQRLFDCVDQELPGQARPGAAEHTVRLLFKLFDREQTGTVFLHAVEAVMIALSGDVLSAKHAGSPLCTHICKCFSGFSDSPFRLSSTSL